MSLNARSIAVRGLGYGALAVALAGFITTQEPAQSQPTGGGGGGGPAYLVFNVPQQPEVDHRKLKMIAMQRAEEEILLAIIVNAVTNNLLDG